MPVVRRDKHLRSKMHPPLGKPRSILSLPDIANLIAEKNRLVSSVIKAKTRLLLFA